MCQMLDTEAKTPRSGWTEHQPVPTARKVTIIERFRKLLVVPEVIFPADPLLRHSGGAAGFEYVEGPPAVGLRHPPLVLLVPEPLVFKVWKPTHVGKAVDLPGRIPACLLRPIQPERT